MLHLNFYMVLVIVYCLFTLVSSRADDPIVRLPDGTIQGRILKSLYDKDYYSFQGIPYAAAPVGLNRYKEPKNPDPWDGILNTTDNRKICMQHTDWTLSDVPMNITEDCLYLNVFTPLEPGSSDLIPVLVWLHGGGFSGGSGTFYSTGPKWFMDYGIVVVTINYRLGPLGFLTTMDSVIPGNIGLKDQRQALRWVNKNIKLFGGDPEKVTIAGQSAGAFSVSYQLLGSNSNGLFRAAIQESGTSITRESYTDMARSFAFQLGSHIDKTLTNHNSTSELLQVLLNADADDIISAKTNISDPEYPSLGFNGNSVFMAVIENDNDSLDPFITAPMYESFLNGNFHQVPTLVGFNSEEALRMAGDKGCYFGQSYDENPALMISRKLNIAKEDYEVVGAELKRIYTNSSFADNLGDCIKYTTAAFLSNPVTRQAEVTSQYVPVYLYQFSYAGTLGAPYGRPYIPGTEHVAHSEDLKYLWEFGYNGIIPEEDLLTVRRLHTLWTNFVKYLNPTPVRDELLENLNWTKVVPGGDIEYLNINNTLDMQFNPRYYQKVNALFQKYQQPPFVVW